MRSRKRECGCARSSNGGAHVCDVIMKLKRIAVRSRAHQQSQAPHACHEPVAGATFAPLRAIVTMMMMMIASAMLTRGFPALACGRSDEASQTSKSSPRSCVATGRDSVATPIGKIKVDQGRSNIMYAHEHVRTVSAFLDLCEFGSPPLPRLPHLPTTW